MYLSVCGRVHSLLSSKGKSLGWNGRVFLYCIYEDVNLQICLFVVG